MLIALPVPFEHALTRRAVACLVLFALSALTILPNLGYPRAIVFDETYYITHAQKYLNGVFFLQTHPPLGKLLIAASERWLHPDAPADEFLHVEKIETGWPADLDITGYRLMPALFGVLNPILVFIILVAMVGRDGYAFAMALFIALDNALVVQARAAMLDSFLISFCLASLLVFCLLMRQPVRRRRSFLLLAGLWGVVQACAANVKFTGAVVLVLTVIYGWRLWRDRRYRRLALFGVVFVALFAATYLGLWEVHFSIARKINPGNDYGISDTHWNILIGADHLDPLTRFAIQFKEGMEYSINSGFRSGAGDPAGTSDEIGSPWYWWLVGGRAIDYRWETADGVHYAYVYLLGNPVTWMVSLLGVVMGTAWVIRDLLRRLPHARGRPWLYSLVLLYWSYMAPMMAATRVTYLYHYLFPLILGVLLFGLMLPVAPVAVRRAGILLAVGILLLIVMFWAISPLTYAQPLTREQFLQRNIIPTWDLKCGGC